MSAFQFLMDESMVKIDSRKARFNNNIQKWTMVAAKQLEQRSHNLEVPSLNPPGAKTFSLLLLLSMADCPLSGPSRVSRTLEPIELLNKIFAALPISFNNACCVALGQGGFN